MKKKGVRVDDRSSNSSRSYRAMDLRRGYYNSSGGYDCSQKSYQAYKQKLISILLTLLLIFAPLGRSLSFVLLPYLFYSIALHAAVITAIIASGKLVKYIDSNNQQVSWVKLEDAGVSQGNSDAGRVAVNEVASGSPQDGYITISNSQMLQQMMMQKWDSIGGVTVSSNTGCRSINGGKKCDQYFFKHPDQTNWYVGSVYWANEIQMTPEEYIQQSCQNMLGVNYAGYMIVSNEWMGTDSTGYDYYRYQYFCFDKVNPDGTQGILDDITGATMTSQTDSEGYQKFEIQDDQGNQAELYDNQDLYWGSTFNGGGSTGTNTGTGADTGTGTGTGTDTGAGTGTGTGTGTDTGAGTGTDTGTSTDTGTIDVPAGDGQFLTDIDTLMGEYGVEKKDIGGLLDTFIAGIPFIGALKNLGISGVGECSVQVNVPFGGVANLDFCKYQTHFSVIGGFIYVFACIYAIYIVFKRSD